MRMFHKLRPASLNFGRIASVYRPFTGQVKHHTVRQANRENPFPDVDHNTLAGGMQLARAAKTARERSELQKVVLQNQMHSSIQSILSKM